MHATTTTCDVLVVGAGPSGLTTAAALTRAGLRVLIVEKHPSLSVFPKATGLRPRTMEILRTWGLEKAVLARSARTTLTMRVSPTLAMPGQEVGLGLPSPEALAEVSPTTIALCAQDRLEEILLAEVRAHRGACRFSTELIDIQQEEHAIWAITRSRIDGSTGAVRARYLVGADGARSTVRDLLGIRFVDLGSEGNHLGTLFRADLSAVTPEEPHALHTVVGQGIEGMFVATGEPDRWVYDMEWHPEAGERREDWTPARVTARIRAAAGIPDLAVEIVGIFPWDFGASVAERQHSGRAFLVGDAAHRTTPRGATGMNTGMADAHNLGWKLAYVLKGWADPALLDTYEAERGPVGRANAQASLRTLIGRPPESGLAHDFGVRYGSAAITGSSPLAGCRAPHAWVGYEGRRVSTIDLFEGRFTLLIGTGGEMWRRAAVPATAGAQPLDVLGVGAELADPTGTLRMQYHLAGSGCVLVRPDGYVAWACDEAGPSALAELRQAVNAATGGQVCELVA